MFRHRFPLVTTEELGIFLVQQRRKIQKISSQNPNSGRHIFFPPWMGVEISGLLQVQMLPCYRVYLNSLKILGFFFAELSNIMGKIKPSMFCRVMHWPFRCPWLVCLWWVDTPYSLQVPKQLELCVWWHVPETWCCSHVFLGGFSSSVSTPQQSQGLGISWECHKEP